MADLLRDKLLSFAEASRLLSTHPHVSTMWRWYCRGVRGRRLRTIVVGGRRYTTEAFLREFIEGLTSPESAAPPAETGRRAIAAARELDRLGF